MSTRNRELQEIIDGLSGRQKQISPKYFYDERGSQLFDEITRLPEYYLTNTEISIMRNNVNEMAECIGRQASLIEFGSGSSIKTRILLEHLSELAAYVPVDISVELLLESASFLREDFPQIEVLTVVADFTKKFQLPTPRIMPLRNVVYFPGSTIGNFEHPVATELLRVMYHEAGDGGALLIGVDLQKNSQVIEDAYNDSAGVTAAFNLNVLRHLNHAYGANFNLDNFEHSANYDKDGGRVVLELVSQDDQAIEIGTAKFYIARGETILTEYSHKYTLDGFAGLADEAGFEVARVWTDESRLFSVQFLTRD